LIVEQGILNPAIKIKLGHPTSRQTETECEGPG
jgi:hypothetical protein